MKAPRKPAWRAPATITTPPPDHGAILERIEQKLDVVIASATPKAAPVPEWVKNAPEETITQKSMERMFQAMRRRDKIPVIKEVRAMLGIGLKEAKDLCEQHFFNPAPEKGYTP